MNIENVRILYLALLLEFLVCCAVDQPVSNEDQLVGKYIDAVDTTASLDQDTSVVEETWYYDNGEKAATANFYNGERIGGSYWYYPSGAIERYLFFSSANEPIFRRLYDVEGDIILDEGSPFVVHFHSPRYLSVGQEFKYSIEYATPPHTRFNAIMKILPKGGKPVSRSYSGEGKFPLIIKKFLKEDTVDYFIEGTLQDTLSEYSVTNMKEFSVVIR